MRLTCLFDVLFKASLWVSAGWNFRNKCVGSDKKAGVDKTLFLLSLSTTPFAHHCNCSINNLKEQEEAATRLVGNFPAFSLGNLLFFGFALFFDFAFWLCARILFDFLFFFSIWPHLSILVFFSVVVAALTKIHTHRRALTHAQMGGHTEHTHAHYDTRGVSLTEKIRKIRREIPSFFRKGSQNKGSTLLRFSGWRSGFSKTTHDDVRNWAFCKCPKLTMDPRIACSKNIGVFCKTVVELVKDVFDSR